MSPLPPYSFSSLLFDDELGGIDFNLEAAVATIVLNVQTEMDLKDSIKVMLDSVEFEVDGCISNPLSSTMNEPPHPIEGQSLSLENQEVPQTSPVFP